MLWMGHPSCAPVGVPLRSDCPPTGSGRVYLGRPSGPGRRRRCPPQTAGGCFSGGASHREGTAAAWKRDHGVGREGHVPRNRPSLVPERTGADAHGWSGRCVSAGPHVRWPTGVPPPPPPCWTWRHHWSAPSQPRRAPGWGCGLRVRAGACALPERERPWVRRTRGRSRSRSRGNILQVSARRTVRTVRWMRWLY